MTCKAKETSGYYREMSEHNTPAFVSSIFADNIGEWESNEVRRIEDSDLR